MMKISILSIVMIWILVQPSHAQGTARVRVEPKVESSASAKNQTVELLFTPEGNVLGNFSMQIRFESLTNINFPLVSEVIAKPKDVIGKLSPEKFEDSFNIGKCNYSFIRGRFDANPNLNFVYRLPIDASCSSEILEIENPKEEYMGKDKPEQWNPILFELKKGDVIYAARKGVVVEVNDSKLPIPDGKEKEYLSQRYFVVVEHEDGSLADYYFLERGSVKVEMGDVVYPNTPIGLAGTTDGENYQMTFVLYHAIKSDSDSNPFTHESINPIFSTSENGEIVLEKGKSYTPKITDNLITTEMSKRDKSKYLKK